MSQTIQSDPGARLAEAARAALRGPDAAKTAAPDESEIKTLVQQMAGHIIARTAVPGAAQAQATASGDSQRSAPAGDSAGALAAMVAQMRQEQAAEQMAALKAGGHQNLLQAQFEMMDMQDAMGAMGGPGDTAFGDPGMAEDALAGMGKGGTQAPAGAELPVSKDNEILFTLQKHMDKIPDGFKFGDLERLSKDESLPPDLREAYAKLNDNPELLARLDNANLSGGRIRQRRNRDDEKITHGDLRKAFEDPALVAYNQQKSQDYAKNYIPSDATDQHAVPHAITASEAARELHLYADSLPDTIDRQALQDIVDGKCGKKCPAQLQAAAQFMLDNEAEFKKLAPEGRIARDQLEASTLANIQLHQHEVDTLQVVQDNKQAFLDAGGGTISRDSLEKMRNDTTLSQEVRDAATQLLANPLIFGMLDNGDKGFDASRRNKTHDKKISGGDIDACLAKLTKTNLTPPPEPTQAERAAAPATERDAAAVNDMMLGMADDPELKESRGGRTGLKKFLSGLSRVLDVVKVVLDSVASVLPPGLSTIVAGIGAGVAAANNFGCKMTMMRMDGMSREESRKAAGKMMAMDAAGSALSMIPGGGIAAQGAMQAAKVGATVAVKEGAEAAVKVGVREGAEAALKTGVKEGAESAAARTATTTTRKVTQEAAETGTQQTTKQSFKEGLKDGVQEAATDQAMYEAQMLQQRKQQYEAQVMAQGGAAAQGQSLEQQVAMQIAMNQLVTAANTPIAPPPTVNVDMNSSNPWGGAFGDAFGVEGDDEEEEAEEKK